MSSNAFMIIEPRKHKLERGLNGPNTAKKIRSFSLDLKKVTKQRKKIQKLTTNDGRTLTDSRDILQEEVSYYLTNTLSQTDSETCENEISLDDCKSALFSMKLNQSPGSDGLSVEFYQAFWDNLKVYFYNSLKETYQNGYMSETQRKGILSLIFKKGDPTNLSNWRPIT